MSAQFGLLNSIIAGVGNVVDLHTGDANKLTIGKITVGSKNYNPSRIQIGYRDGSNIRYFEYNRYIKYGEVIETENLYLGAGQKIVVRSTESDVNFLFYGQTTNDIINPVRSGVLSHTLSTGPTKQAIYTAPSGSESKVTVSICNLGPDVATVKLGLSDGGLENFDSTEYLDFGFKIGPGQTYTRPDIKLGSGQSLVGFSNPGSKVTFLCHGQLFYEVSGLPTSDDFVVLGNTRIDGSLGIGRTAGSYKLDILGDMLLTGNTVITGDATIKNVSYNEDISNVRNISSTGISTFLGDVTIKGDNTTIKSQSIIAKSNDIILGFTTVADFTGSISAGSSIVTNCNPTDNLAKGIEVSLNLAQGNLTLDSGSKIVSVDATTITLSNSIGGNGSDTAAEFETSLPNDDVANNGGIVIKGTTDKSILWQTTTDDFNFSHGITLHTGRLHLVDPTQKVRIGTTDVLTADKVLGLGVTTLITALNDDDLHFATAAAITKRGRKVSSEQYFMSSSW